MLSLVYSNIPPIKKGTDSRFGFGFRLGEHADYQVLIELGPQKYTRPLGNLNLCRIILNIISRMKKILSLSICLDLFPIGKGADSDDSSSDTSKRMVDQTDYSKKPKAPITVSVRFCSYINRFFATKSNQVKLFNADL